MLVFAFLNVNLVVSCNKISFVYLHPLNTEGFNFQVIVMISINNVSVLFGDYALLDSISFLVNKRDRIGLTGRNGAGKSTLLKILAGVQEPSAGSVSMPSGLKVGYLPQTKVYAEGKTVREEAGTAFNDVLGLPATGVAPR